MAAEIQTSKIKIFKTCLTPARNALVDNLEGYLNTLVGTSNETYSNDEFQYLQMEKDMDIKINMTQAKVIDQSLGNYVKITESGKTWYYFLLKTTWKSRQCVELKLSIDSVNTFRKDLTFSDKTKIKRQSMPQFGLANPGTGPKKVTKPIDRIEIGKQYWFSAPSSPSSESGYLQTDGNNIIFRRMSSNLSTMYEAAKIGKVAVNTDGNFLTTYRFENNTYVIYKTITLDRYNQPNTEADLKGLWTIEFNTANTSSTDNVNAVLKTLGGEIVPSTIYTRLIDKYPEQLSIQQERVLGSKIQDNNNGTSDLDWYLIYKTRNLPTQGDLSNPIDCFCIANKPLVISKTGGGASRTLTPADLPEGQYNYVLASDNPQGSFTAQCDIRYDGRGHNYVNRTFTIGGEICEIYEETSSNPQGTVTTGYQEKIYRLNNFKFVNIGSSVAIIMDATFLRNGAHHSYTGSAHNVSFSGYVFNRIDRFSAWSCSNGVPSIKINELNFTRVTYDGDIPMQYAQTLISDTMVYNVGTQITRSTIALSAIDKTDSKLIKIIKLPYAPVEITYSNGVYTFPSSWTYTSGLMKLNDAALATEFSNTINELTGDDLPIFWNPERKIRPTDERNWYYENKIYHSDFYTYKIVYDSFVKTFKLENFDLSEFVPNEGFNPKQYKIPITFKPTNTINSKFAFNFDMNEDDNFGIYYRNQQDFEEFLLVDRNNEETIFSNAYIDYIRNGYNYDQKAKQQQERVSSILTGVQLAAGIASFAASGITGGVSAAAGIALVSGALSSFISLANTRAQNENTIQSKLANLKAQSTNIAGADDVDLMSYYCGNKLRQISYRAIAQDEKFLADFFHFCGYNHPVIETPELTTRYWFNFIQCTPVFNEEGKTVYNDYVDDVKSRYEAGVTVYHYHAGVGDQDGWDWNQEYQNWDSWMLE